MLYTPAEARAEARRLIDGATQAAERLPGAGREPLIAIAEFVLGRTH